VSPANGISAKLVRTKATMTTAEDRVVAPKRIHITYRSFYQCAICFKITGRLKSSKPIITAREERSTITIACVDILIY